MSSRSATTLSPIIMEVENYPKWKDTNIRDIPFSACLLIWSCQGSDRQWYFRQLPGSFGHFRRFGWSKVHEKRWGVQQIWPCGSQVVYIYIFSSSHLRRLEMDHGDVLPTIFPCRICRSFLLIQLLIKVPWNKLILHLKEIHVPVTLNINLLMVVSVGGFQIVT